MDFTQHNKINSCFPTQNRVMDCRPSPRNFNAPQYQKYSPGPSYSIYQQPPQQQQPQNMSRNPMMQHGDGSDKVVAMSKCYKPYTFSTPPMNPYMAQQKSYYEEPEMNPNGYDPMNYEDQMAMQEDDLKIEFFQCARPPPKNPPKMQTKPLINQKNPFRPVLESLRQYSDTDTHESQLKPALENHQTYFFSHNGDDADENRDVDNCREENDEEIVNHQNSYKSRTKIVQIPNGVRIVTEIVKNGECGNEVFRNFRQLSKPNDTWQNKSKMILDDDDNKLNNGDDDGNSNEIDDEDYGKDRKSLINL